MPPTAQANADATRGAMRPLRMKRERIATTAGIAAMITPAASAEVRHAEQHASH